MPHGFKFRYAWLIAAAVLAATSFLLTRWKSSVPPIDRPTPLPTRQEHPLAEKLPSTAPIATPTAPAPMPQRGKSVVRHEESLAIQDALLNYPAAFEQAVERGDSAFATELLTRKAMEGAAHGSTLFSTLQPFMDDESRYGFLWQDPTLVYLYWGACVDQDCDRKSFKTRLGRSNPTYLQAMEPCLDSWAVFLPILQKPSLLDKPTLIQLRSGVMGCLKVASAEQEVIFTQVQYYLGFTKRLEGAEAASTEYQRLAGLYQNMPPMVQLIPDSKP